MRAITALTAVLFVLLVQASYAGKVGLEPMGEVMGTVDGVVAPIRSGSELSGRVCVPKEVYSTPETRYRFYVWVEKGKLISTEPCLEVGPRQNVTARYLREHLVTVFSEDGSYVRQVWAEEGRPVELEVPLKMEEEGVQLRLRRALLDGRLPLQIFEGKIVVGVSRPVTVQLVYAKYIRVNVTKVALDGEGRSVIHSEVLWAEEGMLKVEPEKQIERDGKTLQLEGYELEGEGSASESRSLALKVDSPSTLFLYYRVLYPIVVSDASGSRTIYARKGEVVEVSAADRVKVGPTELVFAGWKEISALTPKVELRVNGSARLTAVYRKFCDLTVQTPLGSQTRSLEEGQATTIALPQELPATPFTKRTLKEVYVDGMKNGPVPLVVRGCSVREVTAVYEVSYDLVQIGLLVGGIVGLAAGYVVLRKPEKREERIPLERLANGASTATICPNCGSPVDAAFCPSCGSKLPK
jgi:hypothetical protein